MIQFISIIKVFKTISWIDVHFIPFPLVNSAKLLSQIYVPTNPKGAERLPPGIVVSETDLYLRRLWGEPSEVSYCFCHFSLHLTNGVLFF